MCVVQAAASKLPKVYLPVRKRFAHMVSVKKPFDGFKIHYQGSSPLSS
jgi:hypothetical protein